MNRARRRQKWLLLLGVLHGVFIYFGDILTMYALIGWLLLHHVRMPWNRPRGHLRRALVWALVFAVGYVALIGLILMGATETGTDPEPISAKVASWTGFWSLNLLGYLIIQSGALLLGFPLLCLLMLAGIAAARLRWLAHPRWQGQRQRLLRSCSPEYACRP